MTKKAIFEIECDKIDNALDGIERLSKGLGTINSIIVIAGNGEKSGIVAEINGSSSAIAFADIMKTQTKRILTGVIEKLSD